LLKEWKEFNRKPHKDKSGFKFVLLIEFCCTVLAELVEMVVEE